MKRIRISGICGFVGSTIALRLRQAEGGVVREMAPRPFDIPWMVLDSSRAELLWDFRLTMPMEAILNEIADHAQTHPDWLEISAP
jgi:nucleoside-diphosphate-sugar epimerase